MLNGKGIVSAVTLKEILERHSELRRALCIMILRMTCAW